MKIKSKFLCSGFVGLLIGALFCALVSALFCPPSFAAIPQSLSGLNWQNDIQTDYRFDEAKRATVLVFLSARCPCSASHEVALKQLFKEYYGRGFNFVGVHSNRDETAEVTRGHFKASDLPFPVLQDVDTKIANQFGAVKTPHVFVVSPRGSLMYQGGIDDSQDHSRAEKHFLKEALAALAQGKSPEIKETRTLGCVIQR